MRIRVDFSSCDSNGLCAEAAPDIFEVRDDDRLHVLTQRPAPQQWPQVEAAARACPKLAIQLEE